MAKPKKSRKRVEGYIRLQIPAGKANPSPPVGPALGQRGLNIMEFCNAFNAATKQYAPDTPIPVTITVYADRSFDFETRTPPAAWYIQQAVKVKKGSAVPNKDKIGVLQKKQLREIAEAKMPDLNAADLDAAMRMIAGTARSMGVDMEEERQ
ncbi:MAG: 50S ribosomal protein L11 [Alphaproteobacteria bacterium]|nr:50S ribosomal protein L11 [Alphaproteobacteria bacterium]MDA7982915.1 50S ribosomal protein L11 [Alphaproteobacteria bacterium]MDA7983942.1 50S ribosomal protein L11 [Alphaproteobacteria bacterium]MDA7986905.1 50S ribosomal protein L11 [Alphaproteobacteria bacterium]MDA7988396.1 50S ribosomal protein L11 [Alphaproteobacteria bacterium]